MTAWEVWKRIEHWLVIFLILLFTVGAAAWHWYDCLPNCLV